MTIKAVFFDIDGTLVDSNEFHVDAWERAFQESLVPVDRAAIHQQIGKGADMLLPTLVPHLSERERKAIADLHGHIFQTGYLSRVRPFAHARDLLTDLHSRGLKVLLASSAKQDEVDHYIDLLDARRILFGTTSGDDVAKTKPAGDIFRSALGKVAPIVAPEVVAIGDTPYDVTAARKAGIKTIGVKSGGFSESSLVDAGAIAIYDSVGNLYKHLEDSLFARAEKTPNQGAGGGSNGRERRTDCEHSGGVLVDTETFRNMQLPFRPNE
jgi:HAD superfamily hydrolase (TIGR01509 family)